MLVIQGKRGKSQVLLENFVCDGTHIVETADLSLSKMVDSKMEITTFVIESNSQGDQEAILKAFEELYNTKEMKDYGGANILFYLNVKEDEIEKFAEFESKLKDYELVRLILTVQADNDELEYYECTL